MGDGSIALYRHAQIGTEVLPHQFSQRVRVSERIKKTKGSVSEAHLPERAVTLMLLSAALATFDAENVVWRW
jgi:hypothetical protein